MSFVSSLIFLDRATVVRNESLACMCVVLTLVDVCAQYFAENGITAAIVPLPTMEANKDFELVFELARQMEQFKLNRCVITAISAHSVIRQ